MLGKLRPLPADFKRLTEEGREARRKKSEEIRAKYNLGAEGFGEYGDEGPLYTEETLVQALDLAQQQRTVKNALRRQKGLPDAPLFSWPKPPILN
jgi:hypothetical protein